ncbi:hypothetical protein BpHYR1_043281 [Brachionus plicatilis]|uniref:Uncharacterized protein n=1 Tax=Brachionus plicatilis TaxID=10195 RepID=A0A3M7RJY1_BRAPC|nr:hypothetical protein BpHYR1_043281 [Brachionus plicatilis]
MVLCLIHFLYVLRPSEKLESFYIKQINHKGVKKETGIVCDRSRIGRPRKLTFRDESYTFREIRKNPTSSYQKLVTDFNSKTQGWLFLLGFPNIGFQQRFHTFVTSVNYSSFHGACIIDTYFYF